MKSVELKKGLYPAAGWALAFILLAAILVFPAESRSSCSIYCTCSCGILFGSENLGPFNSTSQCDYASMDAMMRCSSSPGCSGSCTTCANCEPPPPPPPPPSAPAPQPSQPAQPAPETELSRAMKQYQIEKNRTPEEVQQVINDRVALQTDLLSRNLEKREGANTAIDQLACSQYLAKNAASLADSGQYQAAQDMALQSQAAMNGGQAGVSCGSQDWMRYQVPEVPPPQKVTTASPEISRLIVQINQGIADLGELSRKVDDAREKAERAAADQKFWEDEVRKAESVAGGEEQPAEDDLLAQARAALKQSESALEQANREYQDAQAAFNGSRQKIEQDMKSLQENPH